jgi:RNA polymerase sigma factor (sigma-70 family)
MHSDESLILIQRAKDGDREALALLIERYYPLWIERVHGKLGSALRREFDTEDIVQSAMLRVFRDVERLEHPSAFFVWVTVIIHRTIADKARKLKGRPPVEQDVTSIDALSPAPGPGERIATLDELIRLLNAIDDLYSQCPLEITALYLQHFEKKTVAEIATLVGRSERSVARHLEDARYLLAKRLRG